MNSVHVKYTATLLLQPVAIHYTRVCENYQCSWCRNTPFLWISRCWSQASLHISGGSCCMFCSQRFMYLGFHPPPLLSWLSAREGDSWNNFLENCSDPTFAQDIVSRWIKGSLYVWLHVVGTNTPPIVFATTWPYTLARQLWHWFAVLTVNYSAQSVVNTVPCSTRGGKWHIENQQRVRCQQCKCHHLLSIFFWPCCKGALILNQLLLCLFAQRHSANSRDQCPGSTSTEWHHLQAALAAMKDSGDCFSEYCTTEDFRIGALFTL